jgi:hypothetical protein
MLNIKAEDAANKIHSSIVKFGSYQQAQEKPRLLKR